MQDYCFTSGQRERAADDELTRLGLWRETIKDEYFNGMDGRGVPEKRSLLLTAR